MQIVRRARLGNDTEDITLIPGQPGNVAIMDGYDVLSVPIPQPPRVPPGLPPPPPILESTTKQAAIATATAPSPLPSTVTKLFNVLGLKIKAGPRGITYEPVSRNFIFGDTAQPTTLFFTDGLGQATRVLKVTYPNDQPSAAEGLATIPANAPEFPNAIVQVAFFDNEPEIRLGIIDSTGRVVREIVPKGDPGTLFLTGVSFRSPGSLLVSSDDDETIFELDFNGGVLNTYVGTPPGSTRVIHGIEGVEEFTNRQTFAAGGFDGLLAFFDVRTGLQATQVVDYRIGLGLSFASGLAWDSTNNRFLMLAFNRSQDLNPFIVGLTSQLNGFKPIVQVDFRTRRIAYLPDEQLIAATHSAVPRGILFFDQQGGSAGQIDTSALGNPQIIAYIPTTREFAVVFAGQPTRLSVLSRNGALSRTIDLAKAGVSAIGAVTFFNPNHPSGGQFLVTDRNTNFGTVTDFQGNKISSFNLRDTLQILAATAVTSITTGPDAGAFAIANGETSEVVVFRLD